MKFSGTEQFEFEQDFVWGRLQDLEFIAQLIPGQTQVESVQASSFVCRVRPGFSFLAGKLTLTFEVIESTPIERTKIRVHGKGIGAAVIVEALICLASSAPGTTLEWTGEVVERRGLLKPVSTGLIQAAADDVIRRFWTSFRSALADPV